MLGAFAGHHAAEHTSARVVNHELAALTDEHRRAIGELRREITRRIRAIVDTGVADGSFDTSEPRLATTALLSSGVDVARWYHRGGDLTPEQIGAYYADLALRTVGVRNAE